MYNFWNSASAHNSNISFWVCSYSSLNSIVKVIFIEMLILLNGWVLLLGERVNDYWCGRMLDDRCSLFLISKSSQNLLTLAAYATKSSTVLLVSFIQGKQTLKIDDFSPNMPMSLDTVSLKSNDFGSAYKILLMSLHIRLSQKLSNFVWICRFLCIFCEQTWISLVPGFERWITFWIRVKFSYTIVYSFHAEFCTNVSGSNVYWRKTLKHLKHLTIVW